MEKLGTIYKIENIVNGKVYIGQTVNDVNRRLHVHLIKLRKKYHNNRYLQNAFNKYGEHNFKTCVVEKCSINELDDREKYWIKFYKRKDMSYNIEDGGNLIKEIPKETRMKISQKSKEMWENKITRKNIMMNLKRGSENYNSKQIICVNDMRVFNTITDAAEYYNISMKNISNVVRGRQPYCKWKNGKLEFEYYEKGKVYKPKKHVHGQSIKVICVTTGEVFDSIREAADKYNLETTNISKVCKGRQKHTGKLPDGTRLEWAYYNDYLASK